MKPIAWRSWILIAITVVLAIILMLLPLPGWAETFRPPWLLLVLLYWAIILPDRVGIGFAWLMGLLLDTLQGTLLGENAFVFALLAYIVIKIHRRIQMFPLFGQAILMFFLVFIHQVLLFWIEGLQNHTLPLSWLWGNPLASAILWPWLYMVLSDCVKHYRLQ